MMRRITFISIVLFVLLSLLLLNQAFSAEKDLIIVTGSSGGVYYLWGSAIAKIINDNVPETSCSVEATGGQFENPILITQGDADLGLINVNTAWEGWRGIGQWTEGKEYTNLRVIAMAYPSFLTIVTLEDSEITSVDDFNGKSISVGPPMGTTDLVGLNIMEILDIEPSKVMKTAWAEVPGTVRDGLVDAYFSVGGQPWPANQDLESTHDLRFIEFDERDIEKLQEEYPYWTTQSLPADTYESLNEDYEALAWYNLICVDERMEDDLVYELLDALYEHKDIIADTHPSTAEYFTMDTITLSSIVLHKSAVQFYEDNGITIPEELVPED